MSIWASHRAVPNGPGSLNRLARVGLQPGLCAVVTLVVGEADTAMALRTGDVAVLATPRLVALAEEATVRAVEGQLPEGTTTVGYRVQVDHLAPVPVGDESRPRRSSRRSRAGGSRSGSR